MKIISKKREGNKFTIEAEEDYSQFEKSIDKTLMDAGKEINIHGFRPGKAPKEMIERAVNAEAIDSRAAENLISDLYPKILEEAEIEPVDFPKVEIIQQKRNKPFVFKISVDVYPEIELGKYKGLKVDKKEVEVTDDDLAKVLGNLQQRSAKPGPDEKKELPPLDDEFAKKVSQHGTLAELKEEIRKAMLKDRQAEADADVKNKLIAEAAAEAKVDMPPGMIEREISVMMDELGNSLAQSGLTVPDYLKGIKKDEKTLREEFKKSAEIRVRGKIVLRAIAEAENMKIEPEEMEQEFKNLAATSGQPVEELKNSIEESSKKFIEDYMLRQKALAFLVEKGKITIKEEKK
ncbi:MAG: trigger factor [Candidatus Margulisiibacteriota bacterium]